jgi:hypothetical protein
MFGRNHASDVKFIIFQAITPWRQNRLPFSLIYRGSILLSAPATLFLKAPDVSVGKRIMLKRYGDVNFPRSFFYKNRVTIRDIAAKIWKTLT